MKKLDEAKKYYLGNLNKDQRGVLYDYLLSVDEAYSGLSRDEFKEFSKDYIVFDCNHWDWLAEDRTDALELFENEIKQLKKEEIKLNLQIGETFEYNGFICEVKEKIEDKKWIKVIWDNEVSYDKIDIERFDLLEKCGGILTEITDQEFIKQLEEHSK